MTTNTKEYKYEDFYDCVFRKRIKCQAKIKRGRITYDEKDEFFKNPQYWVELVDLRSVKTGKFIRSYSVLEADKRIRNKYLKVGQYVTFYATVEKFERTRVPDPENQFAWFNKHMTNVKGCQNLAVMNKKEAENNIERGEVEYSTNSKNENVKVEK